MLATPTQGPAERKKTSAKERAMKYDGARLLESLTKEKPALDGKLLIAGPCSVESEEQVMRTARELTQASTVHVLRGGVWKPRTRPGSFEGMGAPALRWLKQAGTAVGVPVAVEVATPEHVELAMAAGIDVLWIGARTTVNPFAVQAIANVLRGAEVPVIIKNPVNPDLDLWLGAFERFYEAGVTRLMAAHRGFSSSRKSQYRNVPHWRIPLELKLLLGGVPLICDPSHLCGCTNLIPVVAQEALDFLYDGLMVEVHANPAVALSDAKQQLTPAEYAALIQGLKVKRPQADDEGYRFRVDFLRKEIDEIDDGIIQLLTKRMAVVREIGEFKKHQDVSIYQPQRFQEVLESRAKAASEHRLSTEFITQVYKLIHEESLRQQAEK
jgi:chorismate mutase